MSRIILLKTFSFKKIAELRLDMFCSSVFLVCFTACRYVLILFLFKPTWYRIFPDNFWLLIFNVNLVSMNLFKDLWFR